MKGGSKSDGQNNAAFSSTEKTAKILTSLSLRASHIPFDLVVEIICRLPVKQLIQLCCICKSWNSLISRDSKFAKKHLRLSNSSHDRRHLILSPTYFRGEFFLCHSPISAMFNSAPTTSVKLFKYSISDILMEGPYVYRASTCDGIVCFQLTNSSAMLCNPSVRKFKMLPPPLEFPDQSSIQILYTLVHDPFTNNYKIIAANTTSSITAVTIHTLGTLRGCLSLLSKRRDKFSEVCIMKEYCNDKSWTKLLTIPPVGDSDFDCYNKALYISEDDKVLMEFRRKRRGNSLVVYDSINNTFEIPKCENDIHGPMMAQEVYVESLISPW